jgi:hypothetical protein
LGLVSGFSACPIASSGLREFPEVPRPGLVSPIAGKADKAGSASATIIGRRINSVGNRFATQLPPDDLFIISRHGSTGTIEPVFFIAPLILKQFFSVKEKVHPHSPKVGHTGEFTRRGQHQ